MIVGIDIGGTTTDIVCFDKNKLSGFLTVKAGDPMTSASGALGKFIDKEGVSLSEIESVAITGVGATSLGNQLFGIPVIKVDEFKAIGLGGLYLSGLKKAIVVSMGTGTALVKADGREVQHMGGTGVGGGTLIGLAKYMLNITEFDVLVEIAQKGELSKVDLTIGDIAETEIGGLPANVTASNFGKHSDKVSEGDLALAIINLVCQTIGIMAVFASREQHDQKVVLTGKMVKVPQARQIFSRLEDLFKLEFLFPDKAEFSTAVGAAYSLL